MERETESPTEKSPRSAQNMTGLSEATFNKLADSINQFAASAITSVSVPEFGGSPNEDVKSFLRKFKLATISFSVELRCLALNKALIGAARTWAKANIKDLIRSGDWTAIKKLMVERFGSPNQEIRHHEKLAKLKFDPSRGTVTSFIEEFSECYRRVHEAASDMDIITAVKLKLPDKVLKNLYILDGKWIKFQTLDEMFMLVKRLEHEIVPYEVAESDKDEKIDVSSIHKVLKELRQVVESQKQVQAIEAKRDEPKITGIALAAINHRAEARYDQNSNQQPSGPAVL